MLGSADDAVERVAFLAAPCGEEKAARCREFFSVQSFEQRHQLVAEGEHAVRIVDQDLAELFVGGVIDDIAARFGSMGSVSGAGAPRSGLS